MTDVFAPQQVTAAAQARTASLLSNYRMTPATLMSKVDPSWIPAAWLQYLSFKIAQAVARGNCGLLISAPPRHGKSRLITTATPLWCLENFPEKNVVVSTYGEELSTDFSREIRDLLLNNQDILNVRLRADTKRVTNFMTTKGGGLKAVGLGGSITGRGAHVFLLDDYIKNAKEAMSAQYLEDLWTWYLTVARTRLEPGAVIIIVATRWVTNDIHGRIEQMQKLTGRNFFEIIKLPAIAKADDMLGRAEGTPLFPERYTLDSLEAIKAEVGSRWFGAMFQQDPQGDENASVNPGWFKPMSRKSFNVILDEVKRNPLRFKWVRYWDLASTKNGGDYTAGPRCLYDTFTEDFYIEDMARGQLSSGAVEVLFKSTVKTDSETCFGIRIGMEQEPGSSGKYTIRHFEGIARKEVPGTKVQEFPATNSKLMNAQPLLAAAEEGKVFVVEGSWNAAFIDEVTTYPEGLHDDQMDAVSGAYKLATGKKSLSATWGRDAASIAASQALKAKKLSASNILNGKKDEPRKSSVTFGRRRA